MNYQGIRIGKSSFLIEKHQVGEGLLVDFDDERRFGERSSCVL